MFVDLIFGCMIECVIGRLVGWLTGWVGLIDLMVDACIACVRVSLFDGWVDWLFHCLVGWLCGCLVG